MEVFLPPGEHRRPLAQPCQFRSGGSSGDEISSVRQIANGTNTGRVYRLIWQSERDVPLADQVATDRLFLWFLRRIGTPNEHYRA
jgi:hypothetical protein